MLNRATFPLFLMFLLLGTFADAHFPSSKSGAPSTPPATISSLSNSPSSGTVTLGNTVVFTANFSAAVTVAGGTPSIGLTNGGTAFYTSGSGSTALLWTYTVIAGQSTGDLKTNASSAISLSGSTITNSGVNANLTGADNYDSTLVINSGGAGVSCSGSGTKYYVSTGGSDSNNGTSSSTPWLTLTKVMNFTSYGANDCIQLNGADAVATGSIASSGVMTVSAVTSGTIHVNDPVSCGTCATETQVTSQLTGTTGGIGTYQTFNGLPSGQTVSSITLTMGQTWTVSSLRTNGDASSGDACFFISKINVPSGGGGNFVITSYGGGNAAILSSSGCASTSYNGGGGISNYSVLAAMDGVSGITWSNINLYAQGSQTAIGFNYNNNYSGTITDMTVTNSAIVGMKTNISGKLSTEFLITPSNPITNVVFSGNTTTGESGPTSQDDTGGSCDNSTVNGISIVGNIIENLGSRSGISNTGGALGNAGCSGTGTYHFAYNHIRYMGANVTSCGGVSGIEFYSTSVTGLIEFNEVEHLQPSSYTSGCDWDAIDMDDSVSNAIVQFNYTHDNFGAGYLAYIGTSSGTWGPNIYRYNISENDGGGFATSSSGESGGGLSVYNNSFYTPSFSPSGLNSTFPLNLYTATGTNLFANNIMSTGSSSGTFCKNSGLSISTNFTWKANAWPTNGGNNWQCGGSTLSSLASWQSAAGGGDTGATTLNPPWAGTPPNGGCTWTPANLAGPQPCPTVYELTHGTNFASYIGTGFVVTGHGTMDYYGNAIPNSTGTGYNIGPYGGN